MTPLQNKMLAKIATSEHNEANGNPTDVEQTTTWACTMIETAEDKGVFTSLMNARLVEHLGKGDDALVWLTDAGWDAWKMPDEQDDEYGDDEYGDRAERDIHQDNYRPAI